MGSNTRQNPAKKGINRGVWDLRTDSVVTVSGLFQFGGPGDGGAISGYTIAPGTYTLRLSVGDQVRQQPVEVRWDPNFRFDLAMLAEQQSLVTRTYDMLNELYRSINSFQNIKDQAQARIKVTDDVDSLESAHEAAKELVKTIDDWENTVINRKRTNGQNVLAFPPQLDFSLSTLLMTLDDAFLGVTQGMRDRYNDLEHIWQAAMVARDKLIADDLANFNADADAGAAIIVPPHRE